MLARSLGTGRLAKERLRVLIITFLSYMCFHASRIPPSITKGVLHPHSESAGKLGSYSKQNPGWLPFSQDLDPAIVSQKGYTVSNSDMCALNNAGPFMCANLEQDKHDSKKWCSRYVSKNFKFSLRVIKGKYAKIDCGVANSTTCWIIYGVRKNLTKSERKAFCTESTSPVSDGGNILHQGTAASPVDGCVLYVQAGGHHLPAEVDSDTVSWHPVKPKYGNSVDVVPSVTNGKVLLGSLMTVYLLFYAFGMFAAGHIADQVSLRLFLSFGMFGSGILVIIIGFAKIFDQHNLIFFYAIYGIQGLFQSIGWPTVVAVMGNWFHGDTRGFIMTVWNSHTSVGNMVGKALSSFALSINGGGTLAAGNNWPATFFACGALIATMSFFVFCFLKESPRHAGIDPEQLDVDSPEASTSTSLLTATKPSSTLVDVALSDDQNIQTDSYGSVTTNEGNEADSGAPTGILRALAIPGVVEFALSLFFCKFVAYTFIYWLPYYLGHVGFPAETAGYLSIFFDLGGIPEVYWQ